jgi:SAM-dependent methyltransferase
MRPDTGGLMAGEPNWIPPGVDTERANIARVYDYLLGGSHNFLADQDVGRMITAVEPNARAIGQANRAFLGRSVRFMAAAGVRQFLDIGSGIPTQGNVHEVAEEAAPGSHVAYVDIDPVAIAHSRAILAGNENTVVIDADLRNPEKILAHRRVQRLIDLSQPVGLLLVAVLHFVTDEQDPAGIVAALRDALAPGSYLAVSHGTDEGRPTVAQAAEKVYGRSVSAPLRMRSRAEILPFFDGWDLVAPGLVSMPLWRPDPDAEPADPGKFWGGLVGVARKP